ncbi:class I SAM-dependent methyltransferase [Spirilliplanes yamanashiensis]|uniref:Uncharacterized protein n=1 Tax=Spirilliplanes yamanashiensis TaxID=42233 RepID=A0A8J4DHB2_9ACTN|nr:class I SAM-dependent methyltransferase [Spirilliplanes yamanashiensis]MDP9819200.1 hypothetical protein [Spirilliplanes yamanashiensis]GIJ01977.1 hypothetical protein Sya03_13290 [Spirilliplanes yamanashiensis]
MNPRLIGGEMPVWTDRDPVRGAALVPLLAAAARGRVLVAGPHDPALLDALPPADLTLLVRGLPDARRLAERYPDATVCCGDLAKLAAEPPFDTVVALDGLGRLSSAEAEPPPWAEAFALLLGALRPGGTLLLGVENMVGTHRLIAFAPDPATAGWSPADTHDPGRPAGLDRLRAHLTAAGLGTPAVYAAWPSPAAPEVLLGEAACADDDLRGWATAALARACRTTAPALTDPARLAVDALRHGAAAHLAPAWIVTARRGDTGADTDVAAVAGAEVVRRRDGHWWRHRAGGAERVPAGRTLTEVVTAAVLRRDLPAVREALGAWQDSTAAGVHADQIVVDRAGTLTALAAPGDPVLALHALAADLLGGGLPLPWPGPLDEAGLTRLLAAMTGRDVDPPTGTPRRTGPLTVRELTAERDRLARELADARAQAAWRERALTERETALDQAWRLVALLSDTGPARAGRALLGGFKAARGTARAVVRRLR